MGGKIDRRTNEGSGDEGWWEDGQAYEWGWR